MGLVAVKNLHVVGRGVVAAGEPLPDVEPVWNGRRRPLDTERLLERGLVAEAKPKPRAKPKA